MKRIQHWSFFHLANFKEVQLYIILQRRGSLEHHKGSSYIHKHLLYYKITAWNYILVLAIT